MKRLDKMLSDADFGSRKDLKALIKRGHVTVNGEVIRQPEAKVSEDCTIAVDGQVVELLRTVVLLMNKPAGFVTSTDDPRDRTVMELVPEKYLKMGVVPAGRLDKDTEGLLVLTNDGNLIHNLISPKAEVKKVYYAEHEGIVSAQDIKAFEEGIVLKDGTVCKSAELKVLDEKSCTVTVTEGMYHLVRRMMASRNLHVTYLRRTAEGPYALDGIEPGQCIEIQ